MIPWLDIGETVPSLGVGDSDAFALDTRLLAGLGVQKYLYTLCASYIAGEEPGDDAWVLDFEKWAGLYEVWRDRQQAYAR